MRFTTTVEFSTNDGYETSSSVITRIVNQASYSAFSLDVNGSTLMVTGACSDNCAKSFSAGAGAVGGSFIGGLYTHWDYHTLYHRCHDYHCVSL